MSIHQNQDGQADSGQGWDEPHTGDHKRNRGSSYPDTTTYRPKHSVQFSLNYKGTEGQKDQEKSTLNYHQEDKEMPNYQHNERQGDTIQQFPNVQQLSTRRELCEDQQQLPNIIANLLLQTSAPSVKIEQFGGDPLSFRYFVASFKEVVEKHVKDSRGRLTRLIQNTTGKAKELIEHCIQIPGGKGYATAWNLLNKRYGDTYRTVSAYRAEIKNWPTLKAGDGQSFRRFHNFLIKCQSISSTLAWNVFENPDTICTLLAKMPVYMIDKWNRRVLKIRQKLNEPKFSDFVEFVEEEVELICDPLFSRDAISKTERKDRNLRMNVRVSGVGEETDQKQVETREETSCLLCREKYHELDNCQDYLSRSVENRSKILAIYKRCYGCYGKITPEHIAKTCPNRKICTVCNGKHPTGLHGYVYRKPNDPNKTEEKEQGETNITSNAIKTSNIVSMCIVPVRIRKIGTTRTLQTYAMPDPCSHVVL